ncbi:MAG TPA: glutamyl-tRNA reductase, partial [Leptospiraceae bacterium]|nr:glutamyl-tRNA reductase [Leptospiraceae bacterium]
MRTLYIGDSRLISEEAVYPRLGYQVHTGYDAYSLLLEIASGIRSRLLGETEVMAQFKETFKNENLPLTALGEYARTLRDQIIEDARKIRSSHLRNLGDQSY